MITVINNPSQHDIFEAYALIADYVDDGAKWSIGTDGRNDLIIFTTEVTGNPEPLNFAIGRNEVGEIDFEAIE